MMTTRFGHSFINTLRATTALLRAWQLLSGLLLTMLLAGCGTTRISDTLRTGTEQLLLSTAIERAINDMDFSSLSGKEVYFDPQYLKGVSDEGYIISSMRQRLLAEGALLKSTRDDATYIVEARAGTVGTNRQDVLIGVPQVNLPTGALAAGAPSAIPEIPLAKKTHQRGIAKLAAFAYNQETGQAVWQSGTYPITADSRDTWILGTGPFQRGSIYSGTNLANSSMFGRRDKGGPRLPAPGVSVTASNTFTEDLDLIEAKALARAEKKDKDKDKEGKVAPASFTPAVPPSQPQPGRIPSTLPASTTTSTPASGFTSSTFSSNGTASDSKTGSGGSATAAGIMFFKNRATPTP